MARDGPEDGKGCSGNTGRTLLIVIAETARDCPVEGDGCSGETERTP